MISYIGRQRGSFFLLEANPIYINKEGTWGAAKLPHDIDNEERNQKFLSKMDKWLSFQHLESKKC